MGFLVALAASQPTAPVISATSPTSSSVQVGLVTPSTEPTWGIGSYALYYSTVGSTGPWTPVASGILAGAFPYTWASATPGTTYWMMLTGQDNSPNVKASPPSNTPTVTTSGAAVGTANLMPMTTLSAIASPTYDGTNPVTANAARFNYVLLQFWPGLNGGGSTLPTFMSAIKTAAVAMGNNNCLTGVYQITQEPVTSGGQPGVGMFNAANSNNWWSYTGPGTWPAGSINVDGVKNLIVPCANLDGSALTPLGASGWTTGMDFCYAAVEFVWNTCINGTCTAVGETATSGANPQLDFINNDDQFWTPLTNGQWLDTNVVYNCNIESGSDTTVYPYLQAGYARRVNRFRSQHPNAGSGQPLLHGGNCGYQFAGVNGPPVASMTAAITTPVRGLYDLPFLEAMFGNGGNAMHFLFNENTLLSKMAEFELLKSSSSRAVCSTNMENGPAYGTNFPATFSPAAWSATFAGTLTSPTNAGGQATHTGTYWQACRWALGICLLRSWAFEVQILSGIYYNNSAWLDEYQKGSLAVWNWLGAWLDAPLLTTNVANGPQGMYVRRATNGTVYVNPIGNGTRTVTIVDSHNHALNTAGFGDTSINNGATYGSTFTMYDGDGRILI